MLPGSIDAEIIQHKSQLERALNARYVDVLLLLGFSSIVQKKFFQWIESDVTRYYEQTARTEQVEFGLGQLFERLWLDFLHPILKFFRKQHSDLYVQTVDAFIKKNKSQRTVEIRKLNATFSRFLDSSLLFYKDLMRGFGATYSSALVPSNYFDDIDVPMTGSISSGSSDFNTNLAFLHYQCLLALGNLARYKTMIEKKYVLPSKLPKMYHAHLKAANNGRAFIMHDFAIALSYYSKCIGLMPALTDAYEHKGMIAKVCHENFGAALWFLRSMFTRIPSPKGKKNLKTILDKISSQNPYKSIKDSEDTHRAFLHVVGFYLFDFKANPEKKLFSALFSLHRANDSKLVRDQLTACICFYEMAREEQVPHRKFCEFFQTYVNKYLEFSKLNGNKGEMLINLRLILCFLRRKPYLWRDTEMSNKVVALLNDVICGNSEYLKTFEANVLPTRTHYFAEDVHFKDFAPIGFQFKDFDDLHLFAKDVDVLFGSVGMGQQNVPSRSDSIEALENGPKAGHGTNEDQNDTLRESCEASARLKAILVTVRRVFPRVTVENGQLAVGELKPTRKERTEMKKTSLDSKALVEVVTPGTEGSPKDHDRNVSIPALRSPPLAMVDTFEDIEMLISGHAKEFEL